MDDETRENFGRVVRTLREALGLSRPELRDATAACPGTDGKPISVEMIAKVEQGTRAARGATLRKLAHGLGVRTEELSESANAWTLLSQAGVGVAVLRAGTLAGRGAGGALVGAALSATAPGALAVGVAGAAGAAISSVWERQALRAAVRARLMRLQDLEDLPDSDLVALANVLGARVQDGAGEQPPSPSGDPRQ